MGGTTYWDSPACPFSHFWNLLSVSEVLSGVGIDVDGAGRRDTVAGSRKLPTEHVEDPHEHGFLGSMRGPG